jgi:hypothetical protein
MEMASIIVSNHVRIEIVSRKIFQNSEQLYICPCDRRPHLLSLLTIITTTKHQTTKQQQQQQQYRSRNDTHQHKHIKNENTQHNHNLNGDSPDVEFKPELPSILTFDSNPSSSIKSILSDEDENVPISI